MFFVSLNKNIRDNKFLSYFGEYMVDFLDDQNELMIELEQLPFEKSSLNVFSFETYENNCIKLFDMSEKEYINYQIKMKNL